MIENFFNKLLGKRPTKVLFEDIGNFSLIKEGNMKTIKIIDLLNKIANGEEVPKKIRIDHWCYKFEWIEHQNNYYDKHNEIDLMSCLSCDKEELNYEVHEIENEKKIPGKMPYKCSIGYANPREQVFVDNINTLKDKINEILDYLESKGDE